MKKYLFIILLLLWANFNYNKNDDYYIHASDSGSSKLMDTINNHCMDDYHKELKKDSVKIRPEINNSVQEDDDLQEQIDEAVEEAMLERGF